MPLLSALRCHLNMCPFVNRYECGAGTGPVQLKAIGLIRLVCTLLLCSFARHPLCRPDCFVNKPVSCKVVDSTKVVKAEHAELVSGQIYAQNHSHRYGP